MPKSAWAAQQLGRPVIKVCSSILADQLLSASRPGATCDRVALAVRRKAIVLQLLDDIGFAGVDAGTLAESWRQQPGTPERQATGNSPGSFETPA